MADDPMEQLTHIAFGLGAILKERGQTVGVAESSSGGLVSAALLAMPGASAYFQGGGVIYTRDARRALLDFSAAEATMRAATEDYAARIARDIREKLGCGLGDWRVRRHRASGQFLWRCARPCLRGDLGTGRPYPDRRDRGRRPPAEYVALCASRPRAVRNRTQQSRRKLATRPNVLTRT